MFSRVVLAVFSATIVMSSAFKDTEYDLVNTALGTGTNLMREFSKAVADNPDKYSLDLVHLYKKYEIASKAEQAKSFLQTQFKKGVEMTNENFKKVNVESEGYLKKFIDEVKKEDAVLAEKMTKFHDKTCDLDRILEDIVKYVMDPEKVHKTYEKAKVSFAPLERKLAETIKKIETVVLEHLPKKI